jgi:hypothetical protein
MSKSLQRSWPQSTCTGGQISMHRFSLVWGRLICIPMSVSRTHTESSAQNTLPLARPGTLMKMQPFLVQLMPLLRRRQDVRANREFPDSKTLGVAGGTRRFFSITQCKSAEGERKELVWSDVGWMGQASC